MLSAPSGRVDLIALTTKARKEIEQQTKVWDKITVDRRAELAEWVEVVKTVHKRKIQILSFANTCPINFDHAKGSRIVNIAKI